ncbi:MAG: hypothetical protein H7X89_15505 [Rhizobiales bacterium]|nr:hypothetical protein [Hyphomicrobiales bacterium]
MDHISVFEMFSPIHLAYLKRCHADGREVVSSDLDSIERHHPAAVQDPLFTEYRALAAAGLLRRRPGRKAPSFGTYARLWFAKGEIEDEVKAIWARRRSGLERRQYNSDPPGLIAASRIAWEYGFNCSGATLRARISKERIR